MVGTSKISLTSLSTLDTNSFKDECNCEIVFIASFVPNCFSATIFFKVFIWISNLNLSRSLLKSKDIAKVHDEIFFRQEFQCNISAEIKIWW